MWDKYEKEKQKLQSHILSPTEYEDKIKGILKLYETSEKKYEERVSEI